MKIIKKIIIVLNILAGVLLVLCYFAPLMNPEQYPIFAALGLIFPFLIFLNLFFIIFWLFSDMKFSLISLLLILSGWNAFSGIIGLKLPAEKLKDDHSLLLMSYNIRALSKLKSYPTSNFNENKEKLEYFLKENGRPQLLCLQETTVPNIKFFISNLGYPYYIRNTGYNSRSAILSDFPIKNNGRIAFDIGNGDAIWADILIKNEIFRVYSVHLHSNTISLDADRMLTQEEIKTNKAIESARGMFKKYQIAASLRLAQAQKLRNHIRSSPYKVILCGDFNDTPQSYVYKYLSDSLSDTFKEKGIGFGTTWAGSLPGLKIDYVMVSPDILTLSHQILRRQFSDHYPLLCELKILPDEGE